MLNFAIDTAKCDQTLTRREISNGKLSIVRKIANAHLYIMYIIIDFVTRCLPLFFFFVMLLLKDKRGRYPVTRSSLLNPNK